jgi:hypothetical protein
MQRYNIINSFHAGEPSNTNGIGKWLKLMADNKIPFSCKAVNGTASLVDGQNLIKAGHDGFLVWRKMYNFSGMSDDVPKYGADIETEADRYWNAVLRDFPADLDKNLVFVELINEPDKNWASWLGYLGKAIGERAVRDGFRVLLFGWSGGEPEYEHWQTNGMREFLEYCAKHSNQVGLSLHEYSFTIENLTNGYPYLLGRFWMVKDACEIFNIDFSKVTIYISEFGYSYNSFPTDLNQITTDFIVAGQIYAEYPNIKGCAIWTLDKIGWNGIDKKVHKLMWENDTQTYSPLFDIIINNPYEVNETPPNPVLPETLGQFLARVAEENRVINYNTLAALETAMVNHGYVPYGREVWKTYEDGTKYAVQGARRLGVEPPDQRIYYTVVGDWSDINWVKQGSEPTTPPSEPELIIHDIVQSLVKHPTKTYGVRMIKDITTITIHHTVGISTPQSIASYHVNTNNWPGISYHYVIEQNGKISMTNYPTTISFHAGVAGEQNNEYGLGIALVGNFTSQPPTQAQIESTRKLVDYLKLQLPRAKYVLPHRNMPGQTTACPGNLWQFWFDQITSPVIIDKPVSIKFIPNEIVEVTNTTLNVRQTPNGSIIGTVKLGDKGSTLSEGAQYKDGFDWWRIKWGTGLIGWSAEDYLKASDGSVPTVPPVPPPPTPTKIDIGSFMKADPTCWRVVKHSSGNQEDVQDMDLGNGMWVRRKNVNGEWWKIANGYAWLIHDTSPSPQLDGKTRVYTLYENNVPGAKKNPLLMALNETWTNTAAHWVQFRSKIGCNNLEENSGWATNFTKLVDYKQNYTFNTYGQNLKFDEVIWLLTTNGEVQIYGKKDGKVCGWLGWQSEWSSSEPVELYWDRGVMTVEPNRFCGF